MITFNLLACIKLHDYHKIEFRIEFSSFLSIRLIDYMIALFENKNNSKYKNISYTLIELK